MPDGAGESACLRPFMVGVARIELATPAMSTQCSTTELHAHTAGVPRGPRREPQVAQLIPEALPV